MKVDTYYLKVKLNRVEQPYLPFVGDDITWRTSVGNGGWLRELWDEG